MQRPLYRAAALPAAPPSPGEAEKVMSVLAGLYIHLYPLLFMIKIPFMVIVYISPSKIKELFPHLIFKSCSQNC